MFTCFGSTLLAVILHDMFFCLLRKIKERLTGTIQPAIFRVISLCESGTEKILNSAYWYLNVGMRR